MRLCLLAIVLVITVLRALEIEDPPNVPPWIVHAPLVAGEELTVLPPAIPASSQPSSTQPVPPPLRPEIIRLDDHRGPSR